ncbi:NAD(P)/FAD-dependent oxidoreductase [Aestuariimicrobium kwangyangense]|uniref:NAD(P)/FAD-dependent oxidoreductase n=1 Tax=Aestuariimicrobium kwangyangense TaxID=396389 RepID=UPI0003B5CB45|nr:NAD(P)/FAD-dependent oxidoreductase [Aestuariimicrobium kwangyangense]
MSDHEVIVIGAGLAGLACARQLRDEGLQPLVLEASDRVGGRVATDRVDGFLVDRGFQVLNPAYPHLRRTGVMGSLRMQSFPRAVRVRRADRLDELADPTRRPSAALRDLRTGLVSPRDLMAAGVIPQLAGFDRSRADAFDRAGFTGPLRRRVVDPFLAGVVCESDGSTSARFTAWLASMFALGTPGLPAGGMQALPAAMAEGLDVRPHHRVEHLDLDGGVVSTDQGEFTASSVVVAAGLTTTSELTGQPDVDAHPTTTWWFATDRSPSDTAAIHVDGFGRGPIVTTSVVSLAAPDYAPPGQHLVACLTLSGGESPDGDGAGTDGAGADGEQSVRDHAAHIYGVDTSTWRTLATHHIAQTLPAMPPGTFPGSRIRIVGPAVLCGDQFGNASIEGAISSGRAAANHVLRHRIGRS